MTGSITPTSTNWTGGGHARLLETLLGLKGFVVLSGYPSPLYDDALKGWHRVERMAYADGARERQEVLWINPRAAAALNAQLPFDAAEGAA